MKKTTNSKQHSIRDLFHSANRARVLEQILTHRSLSAGEMSTLLGMGEKEAQEHLRALYEMGIVSQIRKGGIVIYSVIENKKLVKELYDLKDILGK